MKTIVLGLRSGEIIRVEKVRLYPKDWLDKAYSARFKAGEKLKGVSSGIGFLGSPEWAIGGGLALGLVEGLLSASARTGGAALLEEMKSAYKGAVDGSVFVNVSEIDGINSPFPTSWSRQLLTKRHIDLSGVDPFTVHELCNKYKIDVNTVISSGMKLLLSKNKYLVDEIIVDSDIMFIHDDREFVTISDDVCVRHIRWSDVSSYMLSE